MAMDLGHSIMQRWSSAGWIFWEDPDHWLVFLMCTFSRVEAHGSSHSKPPLCFCSQHLMSFILPFGFSTFTLLSSPFPDLKADCFFMTCQTYCKFPSWACLFWAEFFWRAQAIQKRILEAPPKVKLSLEYNEKLRREVQELPTGGIFKSTCVRERGGRWQFFILMHFHSSTTFLLFASEQPKWCPDLSSFWAAYTCVRKETFIGYCCLLHLLEPLSHVFQWVAVGLLQNAW